MHANALASFWDAFAREPNRWERLQEIFEKLQIVLSTPSLAPRGMDDLLEQMEQRLDEARKLFPEPDWLAVDQEQPQGIECYCANHLGALLDIVSQALERLAEERAREIEPEIVAGGGPARD
jgi:hypothetical protein